MVSKGQIVGIDWNRIARLHSQKNIGTVNSRTFEHHCSFNSSFQGLVYDPWLVAMCSG